MLPNGPPPQSTEPGMDSRARELQREFQSVSTKSDSTTRVSYRINYANLVNYVVAVGIVLLLLLIAILVFWLVNPGPYYGPMP